jgi:hypothetical protein
MSSFLKKPIADERLLAIIEELLRTMPARNTLNHETPENHAWLGRAVAALNMWDSLQGLAARHAVDMMFAPTGQRFGAQADQKLPLLLNEARNDLLMRTDKSTTAAVGLGMVFDYFDEVRKIVETATSDILFVDPYMNSEFVSRFLPHVKAGVSIRLLGRKQLADLLPAVELFVQQSNQAVSVRSASALHDRYLFVDRLAVYQSGASFKDGARFSPTTVGQIVDAFPAMLATYESMWNSAKVERP